MGLNRRPAERKKTNKQKGKNEQYPDFACSHEPYYYLDLHELNFPDRDERGCGLVNMTVHVKVVNFNLYIAIQSVESRSLDVVGCFL